MPTRNLLARSDRAHADWLRARWLLARLADTVGLPAPNSPASRFGDCLWARHLQASCGVSAGSEPLWSQSVCSSATSPFLARRQGCPLLMGPDPAISRGDSGRRAVRLRRLVAGRFP